MSRLVTIALLVCVPALLGSTAAPVNGVFALQTGSAKMHAYLRNSQVGRDPLDQHLDMWMTPLNAAQPVTTYRVDMTKLLHVIIVSDDFRRFFHIHPVLGTDGHFTIDHRFPQPALYHVYADGEPDDAGQQVFRFDLPVAGGSAAATRDIAPTGNSASAGPYRVELGTTVLVAGEATMLAVHITRGGKPADDLHPYLGALAHVVLLNAKTLSYVHVHPTPLAAVGMMSGKRAAPTPAGGSMEMAALPDTATTSPDMVLHPMLRQAGTYKLWLQFRGGSSLYVAPFIVTATLP